MKPANRVAVVTGASKGIGKAIALALAGRGYDVALLDVLEEEGEAAAREARALGAEALFLKLDVSSEEEVDAAAAQVEKTLGTPGVLVNNAGIYPRAPSLEMPYALWLKVLGVNLGGAFLCSRRFAPGMFAAGGGLIVNIASGRALQGAARGAHYAASKAGLISLTRSLASEWAPTIRVNAIVPGVTDTDQPRQDTTEEELYGRGSRIPLGRIGQPEDVARGVCLLLSEDAGYVTGQSLCVNGGAIMQ